MLRLRLTAPLPPPAPAPAGGVLLALELACTNESGSVVRLAEPLPLALRVVDRATLLPVSGARVTATGGGGGGGGKAGPCAVDAAGRAVLSVCVTGATNKPFRLRIEVARAARLLPLSSSFGGGAAPAPVHQLVSLAVASVCTPVVRGATGASAGAAGGPIAAGGAVAASGAIAAGGCDGAARVQPDSCEVLAFAHCGRELRVLEQQNAVRGGFGSIVWDCALLLAAVLDANAAGLVRGRRVVDVGTGTGHVALAAANAGAHVVATDLPEMLTLAAANVAANADALRAGGGSVTCMPLPWGLDARTATRAQLLLLSPPPPPPPAASKEAAPTAVLPGEPPLARLFPTAPVGATASLARLQPALLAAGSGGGAPLFAPPYDVVLASEVAYRAELFPPLLATLRSLCAPATLVLLAARRRACCDLSELLAAAAVHFRVTLLAGELDDAAAAFVDAVPPPAAAAAAGVAASGARAPPPGGSKRRAAPPAGDAAGGPAAPPPPSPFAHLVTPPAVAAFSRGAATLSKTAWAPLLFGLQLREQPL